MSHISSHIQLAGTATVGPKGQVVIPADVREKIGIAPGDKLVVLYMADKQVVSFLTEAQTQEIVDKLGAQATGLRQALND